MVWLVPGAFAALLLLAGPIAVHLLARRNARRLMFPATHFVRATKAAAVTLRRPSDIGLLLLRCAIVLAAVLAAAQPTLLGAWRTRAWNERIARAVVLDTSRSMPASGEGRRLAEQEMTAFANVRFDGEDLRDAIHRAADWFGSAPPAQREIVVISDFQRGAIDRAALSPIPASVGIRFIRAGTHPAERSLPLPPISGWRGSAWQPAATIRGDAVEALWARRGPPIAGWIETRQSPREEQAARRALAGAASFGIASPPEGRRAIVVFSGAPQPAAEPPVAMAWMRRAELALRHSRLLRQTGAIITTAEQGSAFVVRANVGAADPMAAAIVRAVMLAVSPVDVADRELEIATVLEAELTAWWRQPAPVGREVTVPPGGASDARWLWALVLVFLGIESLVRRRRGDAPEAADEVAPHAA